jgi:ankyrin repeat protein
VRFLIEAGGDELVHAAVANGGTCLLVASQNGHADVVRELVRAGGPALLLRPREPDGATCLHMACQKGRDEVVRALVGAGAAGLELAAKAQRNGTTPLQSARLGGSIPAVNAIVEALRMAGGEAEPRRRRAGGAAKGPGE